MRWADQKNVKTTEDRTAGELKLGRKRSRRRWSRLSQARALRYWICPCSGNHTIRRARISKSIGNTKNGNINQSAHDTEHLPQGKNNYIECKNVEKELLWHIQDALEERYFEVLVDEFTNLINNDIPTVLQYFFNTYEKIWGEEVAQREPEVMLITWKPHDLLVLLTWPIETLQKMATQARIPFSTAQLIKKGLQIIKNTRDFEIALTAWNVRPDTKNTWDNFKTHFQEEKQALKEVQWTTIQ